MNLSEFTYLINHPQSLTKNDTEELDKIVTEFPFFQAARALRLKGLYNEDSFRYNYALKVAAAYTGDRSVLFDFITSNQFQSIGKEVFGHKQEELLQMEFSENVADIASADVPISENPFSDLPTEESENALADAPETTDPFVSVEESVAADASEETESFELEIPSGEEQEAASVENEEDFDLSGGFEPEVTVEQDASDGELSENNTTDIEDAPAETSFEAFPEVEFVPKEEAEVSDPARLSILESIREATVSYTIVEPESEEVLQTAELEEEVENPEIASEPEASPEEERLELGKPLDFSNNERHSFHEWLQLSTLKPIDRSEPDADVSEPKDNDPGLDEERQKKNELIDKFIESNPKIPAVKKDNPVAALSIEPSRAVDNSYLMTETLARVYLEQKKYDKAIQAYEILILKYPEKSSFFADRILDIKTLKNNNS